MKCSDNEQYSKLKVQREITKHEQSEHGSLQKLKIRSDAKEEYASSVNRSTPCALCRFQEIEKTHRQSGE